MCQQGHYDPWSLPEVTVRNGTSAAWLCQRSALPHQVCSSIYHHTEELVRHMGVSCWAAQYISTQVQSASFLPTSQQIHIALISWLFIYCGQHGLYFNSGQHYHYTSHYQYLASVKTNPTDQLCLLTSPHSLFLYATSNIECTLYYLRVLWTWWYNKTYFYSFVSVW